MKIRTVTFTGADDGSKHKELYEISRDYPFVEWGILFSESQEGHKRFPSIKWILDLIEQANVEMKLSAHLCGKWLRRLLVGYFEIPEQHNDALKAFARMQLNFHADLLITNNFSMSSILRAMNKEFIFQIDGRNQNIYQCAKDLGVKAFPFFDLSHGAGRLPENWESPLDEIYCGYAGGLGPTNLDEQLNIIEDKVGDREIWIDMETNVRSGPFDLLDMRKVMNAIKIAEKWI